MAKGERVSASYLASVYAELGETDQAFEALEKSFAMREPSFVYFKIHPGYDSLHADPRFAQLAQRVGLSR